VRVDRLLMTSFVLVETRRSRGCVLLVVEGDDVFANSISLALRGALDHRR